ncbi:MAG TPA: hypothetical protein VGF92_03855, partial [Stellaceae bacterium]
MPVIDRLIRFRSLVVLAFGALPADMLTTIRMAFCLVVEIALVVLAHDCVTGSIASSARPVSRSL